MRFLKQGFALSGAALLVFSGCAGSKPRIKAEKGMQGEVVEAEGTAPYNASDIPGSRAAALAAAQRAAVELVVGVYVNAKTRVDKAVAVEQKILAQTSGYVKRYEVLKEGRDGEWYKVRIRALVSTDKIREDLDSSGLLKRPEVGNPRVTVLLQEYVGETESKNGYATRALTQVLLNKGFKVMEFPRSIDKDDDPVEIAKKLSRKTAEILIAGLARAQPLGYSQKDLGGMNSYRASINARLIETVTGEVLSTLSQVASGIEGTPDIAAQKSFDKVAELCADDLAKLPQSLSSRSQVNLTVTGITSFEELSNLQKKLPAANGVKDLYLRSFNQEEGIAVLDLSVDQVSTQEIADEAVRIGGSSWTVLQILGRSARVNASAAGR